MNVCWDMEYFLSYLSQLDPDYGFNSSYNSHNNNSVPLAPRIHTGLLHASAAVRGNLCKGLSFQFPTGRERVGQVALLHCSSNISALQEDPACSSLRSYHCASIDSTDYSGDDHAAERAVQVGPELASSSRKPTALPTRSVEWHGVVVGEGHAYSIAVESLETEVLLDNSLTLVPNDFDTVFYAINSAAAEAESPPSVAMQPADDRLVLSLVSDQGKFVSLRFLCLSDYVQWFVTIQAALADSTLNHCCEEWRETDEDRCQEDSVGSAPDPSLTLPFEQAGEPQAEQGCMHAQNGNSHSNHKISLQQLRKALEMVSSTLSLVDSISDKYECSTCPGVALLRELQAYIENVLHLQCRIGALLYRLQIGDAALTKSEVEDALYAAKREKVRELVILVAKIVMRYVYECMFLLMFSLSLDFSR